MTPDGPVPFDLKLHHGGISVPDLDASIAWYHDMLGFEVEARFTIPSASADVAMLQRGEVRLEFFQVPGSAPAPEDRRYPERDVRTQGIKHIAFAVQDVHAAADELRQRGADIVFVRDFDFGSYRGSTLYMRDNVGNLLEMVQQPDLFG